MREVRKSGGRTGALDDALLARDLAESNAEVNQAKRTKHTTTTLTALFTAYFTLLKQSQTRLTQTERQSRQYARVLPLVMQGLEKSQQRTLSSHRAAAPSSPPHPHEFMLSVCGCRFAAMINVDLLLDLLQLLKAIVDPDRASVRPHSESRVRMTAHAFPRLTPRRVRAAVFV